MFVCGVCVFVVCGFWVWFFVCVVVVVWYGCFFLVCVVVCFWFLGCVFWCFGLWLWCFVCCFGCVCCWGVVVFCVFCWVCGGFFWGWIVGVFVFGVEERLRILWVGVQSGSMFLLCRVLCRLICGCVDLYCSFYWCGIKVFVVCNYFLCACSCGYG